MGTSNVEPAHEPDAMSFLFADLEGSTRLLEFLGDDIYRSLLEGYHEVVSSCTGAHGGRVVTYEGDGLFCVFPAAIGAARAAASILHGLSVRTWPGSVRVRCRIGIHTGRAHRTEEGYVGIDVHRAARIGAAAHGGQVLISSATRSAIEPHAEHAGWRLLDLGVFDLAGISNSEHIHRLDIPGLPVVGLVPRARTHSSTSFPRPTGGLIGRADDIAAASSILMRSGVRLVTITGPGGTGKTRLAIEIADRLRGEFPDGVEFVDLSAVRSADRVLPSVARVLGVRESAEHPVDEALASVIGPATVLLVLDNMEQLVVAGPQVTALLDVLPNARVLVTSRTPLRLRWEHEYPLLPLGVPGESSRPGEVARSDAVTLFVERAQAVRPSFELSGQNAEVVGEIVRRLDGLPLAIELAAARMRLFTPDELMRRLGESLDLLDRGPSDAPDRHQGLRAAVQWSHDLLADDERRLFRRLGVFSGGWTLEAALAVCASGAADEDAVLRFLEELVAKSLVVFSIDEQGAPRYRMLETLREFALERLTESGELIEYRKRHVSWCEALAGRIEDVLSSPDFPGFMDEIEVERFNLREAFGWVAETGDELEAALTTCGRLTLVWDTRGYVTEALRWIAEFLDMAGEDPPTPGRAHALGARGWLAMLSGDETGSDEAFVASEAMWRRLGDDHGLAWVLAMHGMTTYNRDDLELAERLLEEAIGLARGLGLTWLSDAWCVFGLAHIALARGDFVTARQQLEEVLRFSSTHGLLWGVGHSQMSLGAVALMTGDQAEASERISESLRIRRILQDVRGIADCLGFIALLASVRGDHESTARLLGAAEVTRQASGYRTIPWQQPFIDQAVAAATRALGDGFALRFAEGREMTRDEAIELAMEPVGTVVSAAARL